MSIKQNTSPHALPDFRNLGVMLRIVLGVNVLALLATLTGNRQFDALPREFIELAAWVEPPLIASLLLLYALTPLLRRLPYGVGCTAVVALAAALGLAVARLLDPFTPIPTERAMLWATLAALALLFYFSLRERAFSPALIEARLLALTARIRPHFLFNSLNAVLGVIRSDPRRAEQALEELSDMFRVLMAENRSLVSISQEIALCRQYLELERLRLGDRLRVTWDIESCPSDGLIPPLMLQPLLENAVYHGIEPAANGSEISINLTRRDDEILVDITNPYHGENNAHPGNHMALDNIRERLMLFFDLEARMDVTSGGGVFRVHIRLPYRRE